MNDIFVTAIYCDDIRQEIGGKQSLMGIYNADLIVGEFPTTLAKLCVQVTVRFPFGRSAENLTVKMLMDETELTKIDLPQGEIRRMMESAPTSEVSSEDRFVAAALAVQFSPLQLEKPSVLRARALVDGREVKANALRIRVSTEAERERMAQMA